MAQLNDLIVSGAARFLNTINGKITNASTADYATSAGSANNVASSALPNSGATAGSYGMANATTGTNNTNINIPYITVDAKGRVTSISNKVYTSVDHTYTIPTVPVMYNTTLAYNSAVKFATSGSTTYTMTLPNVTTAALPDSGATSGTYGPSADVSGSNGSTIAIPKITIDAKGRITSASTYKYTSVDHTYTIPTYTAGTDLSLNSGTFNHTTAVTAGTVGTSSATSGSTLAVPYVTYNSRGHITAAGTHTHTISGNLSATTVSYAGSAGSATKATQDESGNNIKSSYASSVTVSGHTLTIYNKNGSSLTSATLPNDNTDTKVTQTNITTETGTYRLLMSATGDDTTRTEGSRKSSTALFNASKSAFTFGSRNSATEGSYSFAEGQGVIAYGDHSHAEGANTYAKGIGAHAEGYKSTALGNYSHSEGEYTYAYGDDSHVEGYYTTASRYSHAEGYKTSASTTSHTEGYKTVASGTGAHAEGGYTTVDGEGGTLASGENSHAEGFLTTASGLAAHAEGKGTTSAGLIASGDYSHAEGLSTTASGNYSHAEGSQNIASNTGAHAEGFKCTASDLNSHAEGARTSCSGSSAHAEGYYTCASGAYSHAEGTFTLANHKAQHVFGEYNKPDPSTAAATERGTYIEIVGNGNATQSNARTLDWNGNEWLARQLSVQGVRGSWIAVGKSPSIHVTGAATTAGAMGLIGGNTKSGGRYLIATYPDSSIGNEMLYFNYYTKSTLDAGTNNVDKMFTFTPATSSGDCCLSLPYSNSSFRVGPDTAYTMLHCSSGNNRGIYDKTVNRWVIYVSSSDSRTYIGNADLWMQNDKFINWASGGGLYFFNEGAIHFHANSTTEGTGDIAYWYYSGKEKARIWCDGTFSSFAGPNYRCSNNNATTWSGRLAVTSSSDIRLKENVKDTEVDNALDTINQIKVRSFDWKDIDKHQKIGFVADELEELDPKFVDEGSGGYNKFGDINPKSVNNFYMLGYIVKAMQEMSSQIDELKSENAELREEINKLKK